MAGYNGYSKSNNAIDAENDGKMTASKLAKALKVSTEAVKKFCRPCEWHHTSKMYNCTDYYDPDDASEYLAQMQEYDKGRGTAKVYENCTVEWLEWSGTRKRPIPTEREATGCTVTDNGKSTILISLSTGTMTKRKETKGLKITDSQGNLIIYN